MIYPSPDKISQSLIFLQTSMCVHPYHDAPCIARI